MAEEKRVVQIKDLKSGSFVLIEGFPSKVDSVQVSKAGKHGAAKARLQATGIFDNQKRIIVKPGDTKVDIPIIEKRVMQLVSFIGDNVQIMDVENFEMFEVPLPEELHGEIKEGDELLIIRWGKFMMIKGKN